jgi:hypothetical protein
MPSSTARAVRRKERQALPRCNNLHKLLSTTCMPSAHAGGNHSNDCEVRQQHRWMPSTHMQQQHKGSRPRHYPGHKQQLATVPFALTSSQLLRHAQCCWTAAKSLRSALGRAPAGFSAASCCGACWGAWPGACLGGCWGACCGVLPAMLTAAAVAGLRPGGLTPPSDTPSGLIEDADCSRAIRASARSCSSSSRISAMSSSSRRSSSDRGV